MKNIFYILLFFVAISVSSCQLISPPDIAQQNSLNMRTAPMNNSASEGIIIVNLQNIGLVKIKCNQCHGVAGGGVSHAISGKLVSNDFNVIHKDSSSMMKQYGYELPLSAQEILSLKNFLETNQIAFSK